LTLHSWLDIVETVSRILSIAAIPIVLAIGGWLIQRRLQDQSIRRDYVNLALTILQRPDTSMISPEIREWAVDLLSENSPTKLNPKAIKNLKSGLVTLPSLRFVGSPLAPELKQTLQGSVDDFRSYLSKLGFAVPAGTISVSISHGTAFEIEGGGEAMALWNPETHSIAVADAFATDTVIVLRQFVHQFLLPPTAPPNDYCAIESGLASYFPCSFTSQPMVGADASEAGKKVLPPYDLRNRRQFSEIELTEWNSVQNDGSPIWGAAMWQLRELLGAERADRLIADTWRSFPPEPGSENAYLSFANSLLANSASINGGKYSAQVREVFEQRGLRL
jgi:hypothetical protein